MPERREEPSSARKEKSEREGQQRESGDTAGEHGKMSPGSARGLERPTEEEE